MRSIKASVLVAFAWICLLPASGNAFDTESLRRLIAEKRVTSIERLLEVLPLSLLSRYALVFKSRSLQEASHRDPRVILFGDDAKFIVAFNGQPGQLGYNAIEVMDFDDQRNQFFYREFIFPDASQQNVPVIVSEPNPEKCLKCHGNPARPIWDTPPSWPGVFGERYHASLGQAEQEGLASFLANQAMHPRYRALKNLQVFADRNTFLPSAKFLYDGTEKEPPNAALSRLLSNLNVRALAHELAAAPRFPQYQYALLASLSRDCGTVEDYLPEEIRVKFMAGFEGFLADTTQRNQEQEQLKRLRLPAAAYGAARLSEKESLTPLRYLAERGLGISTDAWTTALEKKTYDFTSSLAEMDRQLREIISETDTSIQDLASLRSVGASRKYCKYLRKKSLSAIRDLPADRGMDRLQIGISAPTYRLDASGAETRPAMLQSCIECHQGEVGPVLPFDQPEILAKKLNTGAYPRGTLLEEILFRLLPAAGQDRMPLGRNLSAEERKALEDYFRALASAKSK